MYNPKSVGEIASPCLTPKTVMIQKKSVVYPFTFMPAVQLL